MAKFGFVFVFAFFVLQSLNASSPTNQPDVFKDSNEIQDLINEIDKVLAGISASESKLRKKLNDKFSEIETAADIPGLVTELRQNITQTLADGGNTTDFCKEEAWEQFEEVTKLTSVEHCKSQIEDETEDFKMKLQKLVSQVKHLLTEISNDVDFCLRTYPTNIEEFIKCVEKYVNYAKGKLRVYEKASQEYFTILDAFVPIYTNKMVVCVNDKKQEFMNQMTALIKDVQLCVKDNSEDRTFIFA